MSYIDKTKKEMLSNLQDINRYLDEWGPEGHLKVIPMTWYEKWKPSSGYYSTAYRNPNRKGYMIVFDGEVIQDKLSPYMTYKLIGWFASDVSNGYDFKTIRDIRFRLMR